IAGGNDQGHVRLRRCRGPCGACGHQPGGNARLSHPGAGDPSTAPEQRRGRTPDAYLANELLMSMMPSNTDLHGARLLRDARAAGRTALTEPEAKRLIAERGIATPAGRMIADASQDSLASLASLSAPMVVKVVSPDVLHKSESGGVVLNLADTSAVADAIGQIKARHADVAVSGYLVEEMAAPGVELVIGGNVDPGFGPVLMVGLGGVFVEILEDVSLRLCPISRQDARDMLDSLRGAALLHGARGKPPVDIEAVIDA